MRNIFSTKKGVLNSIFFLLFSIFYYQANAVTYQIGTGVGTNTQRPLYSFYGYNYSQSIYTLAELNAAGATGAQLITNIRYYYATAGGSPSSFNNWTIYIGNTAQSVLANNTNWVAVGGMTQVFSGIVNIPPVAGSWIDIPLTTPITWDGVSNLVVAVDENSPGYSSGASFYSYTGVGNKYMLYYNDVTNPNPASPPSANVAPSNIMPQIQFEMISAIACAGVPTAGAATASVLNACGDPVNLSLSGNSTGSGMTFQWQSSPAGMNTWTNLGAVQLSPSYSTTQAVATDYRCIVTCTNVGGGSATSTLVSVGQNPLNACYCIPVGTNATYYISSFSTTNGLTNISNLGTGFSAGGYGDYTALSVSQLAGGTVNFSVSFANPTHGVGVWIDWNQDGDFSDANETVINTGYVGSPYSSSFVVPMGALSGSTRMRVRTVYITPNDPCATTSYGEAEDYTFIVTANCVVADAGNVTPGTVSFCGGNTTTLTSDAALLAGSTFQWKVGNAPGGPYTNVVGGVGANTKIYTTPNNLADGTYYYILEQTCANCGPCSDISNEVIVTVNPAVSLTVSSPQPVVCAGSSTTINATGNGASYTWNPGGLVGASQTVTPAANTIYTVTSTLGTCSATATILISVSVMQAAPNPVTASPALVCGGATSQLNATGTIGSTINWYDAPTGGTLIGSSPSGVDFAVTPAITTTYYAEAYTNNPPGTQVFTYTGASQNFTVPAGVTSLTVDLKGAKGGTGYSPYSVGGNGGRVTGTISVTGGQVLQIYVGGSGANGTDAGGGVGGFNGGATGASYSGNYGGGGGGGASDIRVSPYTLADRLAVAGGGGGAGFNYSITDWEKGGMGGGLTGEGGYSGNVLLGSGYPGSGGSQVAGGAAGNYPGCTATAGTLGAGGIGGSCTNSGGGGGGGYYGGGGGSWTGGGGGSSFLVGGVHTQGFQTGNGEISLTWTGSVTCPSAPRIAVTVTAMPAPPVVTAVPATVSVCEGNTVTLAGSSTPPVPFTWTGGITDNVAFTPIVSDTYTVTGTDANGCTGTATAVVTVNPINNGTGSASPSTICLGETTVITASATPICIGSLSDFAGIYAPANWTNVNNNSNGTVNTGGAPASISMASGTNASGLPGTTNYSMMMTCSGNVTFNWNYTHPDAFGSIFDYPQYTINGGTAVLFPGFMIGGANNQNGTASIPVAIGDVFEFQMYTLDNDPTAGTVSISTFGAPASGIPGTASIWDSPSGGINIGGSPQTVTPAIAGTVNYYVEITSGAPGACVNPTRVAVPVTVNDAPGLVSSLTPATTCDQTSVTPMATVATGTIAWTAPLVNNTPYVANTPGIYTYTVTATTGLGCTETAVHTVTVNAASGILAPATSNQTQNHDDNFDVNYYDASCDLIATVDDGMGGNILGLTTSTVNVDASTGFHNGQPFVRRWYQITPTSNGSADVILYINQADFDDYNTVVALPYLPLPTSGNNADANIANIRITKNDDPGLGNNPIVITPTVNWNGTYWELSFNTPSFSQFRVHSVNDMNVPLPVSITQFSGVKSETSDKLTWITATESNNRYFTLEHSTDAVNYTTIAKVNTKANGGNSASNITYTASNDKPVLGHNYYRLSQTDVDGKSSIHANIVDLIWGGNGSTVSIYPNPTTDILNIDLSATKAQNTTVKVLDMAGRMIKQVQAKTAIGMNHITVSLGEIATGVYTVQVYENNHLTHTGKVKKND